MPEARVPHCEAVPDFILRPNGTRAMTQITPRAHSRPKPLFLFFLGLALTTLAAGYAHALPDDACEVPDDGTGTAEFPPPNCAYLSPQDVYMIIDGLPPGTTIELEPSHQDFICTGGIPCGAPGGGLGGEVEDFEQTILWKARGTGDLDGYSRLLALPVTVQTNTGPRNPGDPVQSFATDLFSMQGLLPPGDPDFAVLQVVAGTGFGLPSPGQTTLTRLGPPGSDFQVDSFFDVSYQIDFVGAPGGALAGLAGTTLGTLRIEAAGERDPCIVPDDGTGTAEIPPLSCDYLGPAGTLQILDGLPPGTEINVEPRHTDFLCQDPTGCGQPGGGLGGERERFDSVLVMQLSGTSSLDGFRRTLRLPVTNITDSGPRTPGTSPQGFLTDFASLSGALPPGNPDFSTLTITAGTVNGLPSPGYTSLTSLGSAGFRVDSFFDISYQISFVGAPGGALDGLSGTTTGTGRLSARSGRSDSIEDDNGLSTATLPPEGGEYVSPDEVFTIVDGLPPGTTIDLDPSNRLFFCNNVPCAQPGGGGDTIAAESTLAFELRGTGALAGYRRTLQLPVTSEIDTTTGNPGAVVQLLGTDLGNFLATLPPGDPDFDQLVITAGTMALPSPGHTTLIDQGDGTYLIDSFFDISYQIDFVGAPGGQLDGLSGSTTGQIRLTAGDRSGAPDHNITVSLNVIPDAARNFPFTGLTRFMLDDDADPALPSSRTFNNLFPGTHTVTQTLPIGWSLDSISCNDPDGGTVTNLGAREVHIDLDLGEAITCLFTNSAANADLSVTKTDGVTTAVPGEFLIYTIVAANAGPVTDPAVSLTDAFPAPLSCSYTSVAAGGATGNTAAGSGDLAETLSMPAASSVTYTATCTIDSGATGTLSNTASISGSLVDFDPTNNDATDDDTVLVPEADLAASKTDGVDKAIRGGTLVYDIVVSNAGPSDDPSVSVSDTLHQDLTCTYTSVAAGGATGNTAAGSGDLAETLAMPAGSSVTYTLTCDVDPAATGSLSNTVMVGGSVADPTPGNNNATDVDAVFGDEVFANSFEGP